MEQLSLFDNGEASVNEKFDEEENAVDSEAEEVEIKNYTPEQQEILSFAKGIIQESLDPWCPLGIYITTKESSELIIMMGKKKQYICNLQVRTLLKNPQKKEKCLKGQLLEKLKKLTKSLQIQKCLAQKQICLAS